MKKLNSIFIVIGIILFLFYFVLIFSSRKSNLTKTKNVALGQKLSQGDTAYIAKIKDLEDELTKLSKMALGARLEYIKKLKNIVNEINVKILNSFYRRKVLTISERLNKEERVEIFIGKLNHFLHKRNFPEAYRTAKILYKFTQNPHYLYKVKSKKFSIYKRLAQHYFAIKNYIPAKQFYMLAYNLKPEKQIMEQIQTIDNIFKLTERLKSSEQKGKIKDISKKIKKYEENYKLLHIYYLLKNQLEVERTYGGSNTNMINTINTVARKWREARKIAKKLVKEAQVLAKKDSRIELEQAIKKVELAKKYFPYFYKYSSILNDLKARIEYSGMVFVPPATVTYFDPVTKKNITKKVKGFYIDKDNLTFEEYIRFLTANNPRELERLKNILIQHRYRGDLTKKEIELISYRDIRKFAKSVNKKIPSLPQLISFCKYYYGNTSKKYSIFSSTMKDGRVIVFGKNYLMEDNKSDDCAIFFSVPSDIGVPGISVRLVKTK